MSSSKFNTSAKTQKPQNPIDAFYAHLDECAQCEHNPFDLCPTGTMLLLATPDSGVSA